MSTLIKAHQPCPDCGSSDAMAVYDDHTYCFACLTHTVGHEGESPAEPRSLADIIDPIVEDTETGSTAPVISNGSFDLPTIKSPSTANVVAPSPPPASYLSYRGVTADTRRFYGAHFRGEDRIVYPYPTPAGVAKHIRTLNPKGFYWEEMTEGATLWGKNLFAKGSAKAITITEGEEDAMSVYQMQGSKYPCVSVRSSGQAAKDCALEYDYLNSFDKIYLCLDNDDPGRKATREIAVLFDPNKVHIVEFSDGFKDANDYLKASKEQEFVKCWWAAKKFVPRNIINGYDQIKEVLQRVGSSGIATYPFPTLQDMTYGVREGEINLFLALEKVGKTEIMRAIEYHLLTTTDHNIGIIHLEEDEKRSVQGLLSYDLNVPVHLPDSGVSLDDQLKAYERITKRDNRLHFYTHFGSDDPNNILGVIRYLVTVCKCKFLFLDHITMLATGYENDDERRKLDYLSTRLAMLTRELKFTLFLVSHVNDHGQTRGSRNIAKIADLIVSLHRDPEAESFDTRNTTSLTVKGNRFASKSGPAGYLFFDPTTYKIKEKTIDDVVTPEEPF